MTRINKLKAAFYLFSILVTLNLYGQGSNSNRLKSKIVVAGPQYYTSGFHQLLWGRHYRKEWRTPVQVNAFYLDTAAGGLIPYQAGGGRQSKTLRLRNKNDKEFVLRSIDKSFGRALPEIFQKTFVEDIINDQVSIAHPYAAVTIPQMAEAAGIYHTWPEIVYVPKQLSLREFDNEFGDVLYLFEQRPDENWKEAPNFGNSEKIIGTEKLLENIYEKNTHKVDQAAYIKARLFDMFIGDWGRHEDQWRWASFKEGNQTLYKPIPRDRDQTYTKFDGFLLGLIKSAAGLSHLQTFESVIKDVRTYNFPARNLDRQMANGTTLDQWTNTAKQLQQLLTDAVIENSVRQMPPEVYPISGEEIISKLKSRRTHLTEYATTYYKFLSEEVEIAGTKDNEIFEINPDSDGKLSVQVLQRNENGSSGDVIYSRKFLPGETREIRIYGLDGKDEYKVKGSVRGIIVKLIGGPADDIYDLSSASGIHVYDSRDQEIAGTSGARIHRSSDTAVHKFEYAAFKYDDRGLSPEIFYSREDRIYVGLAYKVLNHKWRREPFANKHKLFARYSLTQNAFNVGYEGVVNQFIGGWGLLLNSNYDWVKWTNFYGIGNETVETVKNQNYNRIRSSEGFASIGLTHKIGRQGSITFSPYYQTVKLLRDNDRFLVKEYLNGNGQSEFEPKHFGGASIQLNLQSLNDYLLPTKGISFLSSVSHTKNLKSDRSFTNYSGNIKFYLPLLPNLVLAVENGAEKVTGETEFYQLNAIGGKKLRGYRRERFWGETVYHNNNELQYLFDVRSKLFNGKAGLLAFADQGRVWMKNEKSDLWHYGYGGGFILAPFKKLYVSVVYGIGKGSGNIHVDLRRPL